MVGCNKEYRTQWELNNHHRLKHAKADMAQDQTLEYTIELYNTLNDDQPSDSARTSAFTHRIDSEHLSEKMTEHASVHIDRTDVSMAKRKKRNSNQQIIYVMPGPMIE